nr:immunoglobulin heavy chain junction region [Macaca mulatta]
CVRIQSYFDYW